MNRTLGKWASLVCALVALAATGVLTSSPVEAANSKSPILIGSINPLTGPVTTPGYTQAIQAYFSYVNTHGGVNGHPLQLMVQDAGFVASSVTSAAQQLVNSNQVVGMLSLNESLDCTLNASFYAQQKVPVLAASADTTCSKPGNWFAFGTRVQNIYTSVVAFPYISFKAKNIGMALNAYPNYQGFLSGAQRYAKKKHIKFSYVTVPLTATQADWQAALLKLKSGGAKSIIDFGGTGPQAALALQAGKSLGIGPSKLPWVVNLPPSPGQNFAGSYGTSGGYLWSQTNAPGMAMANQIVPTSAKNYAGLQGYQTAVLLTKALKSIKSGSYTRASLTTALSGMTAQPVPLTSVIVDVAHPLTIPAYTLGYKFTGSAYKIVLPFQKFS